MTLDELKDQIPDYGKDMRLNLSAVLAPEGAPDLTQNQINIVALASAYATRHKALISAMEEITALDETHRQAAKAAATVMAMNNVYYRFIHIAADEEMKKLPAKLRMNMLAQHGIEKIYFEAAALAVSAINGCGMCMEAHVHALEKEGVSKLGAQSVIRIAAVVNAAAQALFIV